MLGHDIQSLGGGGCWQHNTNQTLQSVVNTPAVSLFRACQLLHLRQTFSAPGILFFPVQKSLYSISTLKLEHERSSDTPSSRGRCRCTGTRLKMAPALLAHLNLAPEVCTCHGNPPKYVDGRRPFSWASYWRCYLTHRGDARQHLKLYC